MIKFTTKPKTASFRVGFYELTQVNRKWYTVALNGHGYYGMLIDGRTVYGAAKRAGKLEEYKQFNTN